MFKINVAQNITMLNGEEAKFSGEALSFRSMLVRALTSVAEGDQFNPIESRTMRMRLADQIQAQDSIVLSLEQVLWIAPLIARAFSHPLVSYAFIKLLEDSLKE